MDLLLHVPRDVLMSRSFHGHYPRHCHLYRLLALISYIPVAQHLQAILETAESTCPLSQVAPEATKEKKVDVLARFTT